MWLFSDFLYSFSFSLSTAYPVTVKYDRVFRPFNRSVSTRDVVFDIDEAFDRFWHPGLLQKRNWYRISGWMFCSILFFLSKRRLLVVLYGKFSQEYSVNSGVP